VFKLDMGAVLLIQEPAVIVQELQNFPNRHSISIRIFYTYIKGFFRLLRIRVKAGQVSGYNRRLQTTISPLRVCSCGS
jgi:hypothetical protein